MSQSKPPLEPPFDGPGTGPASDPSSFFDIGKFVEKIEEEQTARMKALLEVSRRMNATLDEEELLPFMMDKVVELMEADHGHLVLLKIVPDDPNTSLGKVPWEVKVSVSRNNTRSDEANPPSTALIRRVLEQRQPMRLDDALTDETIKGSKSAHELGLRSVMAVPLITRDRLLGMVSVENRGKFAQFNEEHLDFLQIFGHQAAVAIENARLYRSLRDAQGQLSRAHKALRLEVEESHQALRSERQRLQVLETEVQHLDKMAALGMMVSGIAHELNNPLTGASGFAQLLSLSTNLNDREKQMVEHIKSETRRCAEITGNLLRFSRKTKFNRTAILLNQMVSEAVDLRRYQFEVNNVRLAESYEKRIGSILADHFQLKGVILNILNNAYDAIQEKRGFGMIEVNTFLDEEGLAVIEITDDGGGIKEPEKIFDPFYTTKEVGKGTGLGMSVAFGVVRAHGGNIAAENTEHGARIILTLPLEPGEVAPVELAPVAEASPSIHVGRILVVDDEVVIRELCQVLLEGEGFQVDLAVDGTDGKKHILENEYDLIITDIRMPGDVSGVDLYRWLKQVQPRRRNRVVFITGDLLSQNLREALGEVGQRLLTKPFEVSALIDIVRNSLVQPMEDS